MKKTLILIGSYLPGYKIGGPQRTIENLVEVFGKRAEIYIYTQDRDMGDVSPYEGIECYKWLDVGCAKVMYAPSSAYLGKKFKEIYFEFDNIYSCGLFEKYSIKLLLLHKKYQCLNKKIFIAPMGVFSCEALAQKAFKKNFFFNVFSSFHMFENIIWSFTSQLEKQEAINKIGEKSIETYVIVEDLPRKVDFEKYRSRLKTYIHKERQEIVFISRISPQKNIDACIRIISGIKDRNVVFHIYGTLENKEYWKKCEEMIQSLPKNVTVEYHGSVVPDKVTDIFSQYDVFLFPTKGENYGHVIFEALAAGCIPIISDRTPWNDIEEQGVGYVVDLLDEDKFRVILDAITMFDGKKMYLKKEMCINYAERKYDKSIEKSGYANILSNN